MARMKLGSALYIAKCAALLTAKTYGADISNGEQLSMAEAGSTIIHAASAWKDEFTALGTFREEYPLEI